MAEDPVLRRQGSPCNISFSLDLPVEFCTVSPKEYIDYIERTATPLVFHKAPLFHRKPEALRKTTPELLSAVLRNIYLFVGGGYMHILW